MKIRIREGETFDDLLRRWKRDVKNSGIVYECRKREFFMTPKEQADFKRKFGGQGRKGR